MGRPTQTKSCCISPGQRYPFAGSTGAPRKCLGDPDLFEQGEIGWGKSNHHLLHISRSELCF